VAKVKKRGSTWQIDYTDPNGKRVRKSFPKKKEAEAELAKRVSLIAEGRYLDIKKDLNFTLSELVKKYLENYTHSIKEHYCQNFKDYFGESTLLSRIKYVHLETYRNHLRRKPTKYGTPRQDSTVNREMSCLHHLFSKGFEWEMVERSPFDRGRSLMLKENNERVRFLTEDEISRLMAECPEHLRRIVVCAINTGMRRGEILRLRWKQIRNEFIYLRKTKTKNARQIPVNDDLYDLFNSIRSEQNPKSDKVVDLTGKPLKGLPSEYVFVYKGEPVKGIKTSFKTARKNAAIEDFKFHDLRHTFASQVLMRGGSLKDVQELLGHKTMTMTLRYAHLTQEHKKRAVNLLNGLTTQKRVRHETVTRCTRRNRQKKDET
jgi:integrase